MGKIVDFLAWLGLSIANILLWPIEKCIDVLGHWMLEDDDEDEDDSWPFGGY